jgi:hypothetical protein
MQRLRRLSVTLLAAASLAGLPACSDDEAKNKADKAGEKVKSEAEKAKNEAEKAKKDVDGQ